MIAMPTVFCVATRYRIFILPILSDPMERHDILRLIKIEKCVLIVCECVCVYCMRV